MRTGSLKWISLILIGLLIWLPMQSIAVYAQALTEEELGEVAGSEVLLDDLELDGAALNSEASAYGTVEKVGVEGQTFTKALRFTTSTQPQGTYLFQYVLPIEGQIEKDDVLLASFYARTISSTHETAEGQLAVVLEKTQTWDKSINETIAIPSQWKKFLIPIKAALLMPVGEFPANNAQLTLRLGFKPQVVEIADLQLINYMKAITIDRLPSTPVTYEGMEDDAPWRAEANERIEQNRKGDFTITVKDKEGRPVEGADIHLKMRNHEFKFGTAVNSQLALGTDAVSEMYRTKLKENFNSVVMENDMKWSWWEGNRARTVQLYNWLGENGFAVRGHALLWDGASRMPADIGGLLNDREAIDKRIKNHFHELAGYFRGRLFDWDVLNEPVLNKLIRGHYGDEIAANWFKIAKEADPNAKLYVNETQILGVDAPVISNLSNILQTLKDNNAPVDGIGIQAHFGSTPVAPMDFYDQLTHFTKYADEIAITEFDMNSPRQDLQAMFTRDILIATFSHPNVQSFTMWGFWDGAHWQNNAPLFRSDWSLKPSGEEWRKLVYEAWWTDSRGRTDEGGVYKERGFYGDYDIIVDYNGVSEVVERSLYKNSDNHVTIVLGQEEETPEAFVPLPIPDQNAEITPPVWPYGSVFGASAASATAVTLTWPDAYDNTAVKGYHIYQNGSLLHEVDATITSFDMTGLAPGTKYTYEVEAVDAQGNRSLMSEPIAVTTTSEDVADATAPGWKKGSFLTVTELGMDGAGLSWPAGVDNGIVGGYRIYVNGKIRNDTTERSYALTNLLAGTLYTVRVEAKDSDGNLSLGGPIVTFKTLGAEDQTAPVWAESSLKAMGVEGDRVTVNWSGALDPGGISAYRLFDGDKEMITLPSSVESYRISGLTDNRTYTFKVEAADQAGNWSTTGPKATVSTTASQDTTAPVWPKSRMLQYSSVTDRSIRLNWTAATDNNAITAYRIYQDDTMLVEVDGNTLQYNALDLEDGLTYTFRVEAGDAKDNWTSAGPAVTVHTSSGIVRNSTALHPSDDVFIQAPAVFGGDGTTNNIAYLRYKNAAGASGTEQNKNTGNNRRAYLKFPLDTVTGSVYEATLNLYVYAVQTPNLDIGLQLYEAGDSWSETSMNWKNKPADGSLLGSKTVRNAGYWVSIPVTDYVRSELNGDGIVSFKLTDDSWLDQNVDVYSKEATGANAAFRPYLSIGTDEIPKDVHAPDWGSSTLIVSDKKPNMLKLAWPAAADDTGVNGYRIYRDGEAIDTVAADVLSYAVTGLTAATTYTFKIEALDAAQETTTGPVLQATTAAADTAAPTWPEGSVVKASDLKRSAVKLEWTPAEDQYGIAVYAIYKGNVKIAEVAGDIHAFTVTGLLPGTAFTLSVRAIDTSGNEASGPFISVMTLAADDKAPAWSEGSVLEEMLVTTSGVWLHWPEAVDDTNVTKYRIYKDGAVIGEVGAEIGSYFAAGLHSDTPYTFHIVAVDDAGNLSEPLASKHVRTLQMDTITPQWPTGSRIRATVEANKIVLTWDAAVDNISMKHYQLYRNGEPIALVDGAVARYVDETGQPDAVYKVEAVDLVGNWTVFGPSTTDPEVPVPQDTMPPRWPLGSKLSTDRVSQTSIQLIWDAAVDQIGVTGYKLFIDGIEAATTSELTWTAADLKPGTEYDFKVEAVDEAGNWSANGPTLHTRTDTAGNPTQPPVKVTEKPVIEVIDGEVSIHFPNSHATAGDGALVLSLDGTNIDDAFAKATASETGKYKIRIKLPRAAGATSYGLQIPSAYLTGSGSKWIELSTEWGTLMLPGHMLANNKAAKSSQFVTVTIAQALLPAGTELEGKARLVLDLSVSTKETKLHYNNKEAPVEVSFPYSAADGERQQAHRLSIWHAGDAGEAQGVPSGRYVDTTGEMRFTTDHFSTYAIVYNDKAFDDLATVPWAREAIEALAARGIVNGMSEVAFNPGAPVTRADFLKLLLQTLGLTAGVSTSSFGDVEETDYFYEAVETAHVLGIASGKADGLFHPRAAITRQEMFALIARAQPLAGKPLPKASSEKLISFKDRSTIAPYAEAAIASMVQEGLVQGSASKLNPTSHSTRAEAAVMMYKLLGYKFD
ncbi:fibronectin type III domain-containing protein [Paenibacillus sp. FJAT-27812]|uniref:fibronectin type III domain-containing protein n=1 Tax=Paenibacillus sp. FJAT-27812 TaxID=1684143 RepID=UPI000AC0576A|nr:endo-1,4-beta-xylanase [Paenibacillus sp. FJAT-27812]